MPVYVLTLEIADSLEEWEMLILVCSVVPLLDGSAVRESITGKCGSVRKEQSVPSKAPF